MGLTNLDVTHVGHGIEVSNTYVYIKDIRIQNDTEFNVYCNTEEHVSRENKNAGKPMIKKLNVNYSSNTLPNTIEELWSESYSQVKQFYTNTVDVVEPNQNSEELSGVTRWRLEEEVANLRTENVRLTEDLRRKEIALQALT
jgi:hypothetical protein